MGGAASAAGSFKENGDNSFRDHNYLAAIYWYTLAIGDASNSSEDEAILFSNRSAAYNCHNLPNKALSDANCCISLRPDWFKGYYRAAVAAERCGQLDDAIEYTEKGLMCMPTEKDLLKYRKLLLDGRKVWMNQTNGGRTDVSARCSSIYSWGEGKDNQLGFIPEMESRACTTVDYPMALHSLDGKHIIDTSCGAMHSVCVASSGEIYSWGNNVYGQCSIAANESEMDFSKVVQVPRMIPKLLGKHIIGVACGAGHTVCIDDQGRAYSWGIGRYLPSIFLCRIGYIAYNITYCALCVNIGVGNWD